MSALLAIAPSDDGAPRALIDIDGRPAVARLAGQLTAHGPVVVLTRHAWRASLAAALPGDAKLVCVDSEADALGWLAEGEGDLLVIEADVVTGNVALERLVKVAGGATGALVGSPARGRGAPVRSIRGRVVAAGSTHHRLDHADGVALGAVYVAGVDRTSLRSIADEAAALSTPRPRVGPPPGTGAEAGESGVSALLLVGLVRSGVTVRMLSLPAALPWQRPSTRREAAEAMEAVDAVDEDQALLDASVKAEDDFFATYFVSTYSRYWARWCARRGLTPNQVTTASLLAGLLAAVAFGVGERWAWVAGAVVLQLAFTLDCVDGQLARYTGNLSGFGAWLDSIFDRAKEYAVYAGLALGAVAAGDDASTLWQLASAALALQVLRHSLDFGYAAQQEEDVVREAVGPLGDLGDPGRSFWEPVAEGGRPPGDGGSGETGGDVGKGAFKQIGVGSGEDRLTEVRLATEGWARRIVRSLRRAEDVAVLKWTKRIVVLPIGERFLLISLVTALVHPRATLLALLGWGAVAAAYTAGGRVVRSVA